MSSIDDSPLRIVEEFDIITGDRVLDAVSGMPAATYFKRDFVFRPGIWRGARVRPSWMVAPAQRRIAVVGHADQHFTVSNARLLRALGTRQVYAFNADPLPGLVAPIPLGLTNHTNESSLHRLFGDTQHLLRAYADAPDRPKFNASIYVNMTLQNALRERRTALEAVRTLPGAHIEEPTFSDVGRIRYLSSLRGYNFVLSPPGNGVDTHRTWETLYMGGIPIVQRHPAISPLLEGLPAVQVDDWRELQAEGFLESEWQRINAMACDFSKLRVSFWIREIRAVHDRLVGSGAKQN